MIFRNPGWNSFAVIFVINRKKGTDNEIANSSKGNLFFVSDGYFVISPFLLRLFHLFTSVMRISDEVRKSEITI